MARAEWAGFAAITVIWGTTFFAVRVSDQAGYDPYSAVALRLGAAAVVLLVASRLLGLAFPRGRALGASVVAGLLFYGINHPLLYVGEVTVNSGTAAVLWGIYPTLVAVSAHLALRDEPLRARSLAGAMLGALGLAVVFWAQLQFAGPAFGFAAILGGIGASTIGTLITKRWGGGDALPFTGIGMALGAAVSAGLAVAVGRPTLPPSVDVWAANLYLLLAGSLIAFPAWNWLLARWPATRLSFQTVLSPLIAVALGAIVLAEPLEARFLAGAALVLTGTWLAVRAPRAAKPAAPAPMPEEPKA
jgi:drug/metabolite transporter (DMT)-like permease